jgi:acylphosphatase
LAGHSDIVAQVVALCRRGPSSARVEAVINEPAEADALNLRRAGESFSVLPTM